MPKKINKTYYFSVEGDTEKWYLEWLKNLINSNEDAQCKVQFVIKTIADPIKMVKSLAIVNATKITHIIDYEGSTGSDIVRFQNVLKDMKRAERLGKGITYSLGYSNLTFELWIILHKENCNVPLNDKKQYLYLLNKAFDEDFENLRAYKYEKEFKRILDKITMDGVLDAIKRAKRITELNQRDFSDCHAISSGYEYYTNNPSLSIWMCVERVLIDCGIITE